MASLPSLLRARAAFLPGRRAEAAARRYPPALSVLAVVGALLAGLTTYTSGASAATTAVRAPSHYYTKSVLSDSFSRYVSSGWGTAPRGGRYASVAMSGHARVWKGLGQLASVRPGQAVEYHASGVNAADVAVQTTIAIGSIPRTRKFGAYLALEMRVQRDSSAYTVTLHYTSTGRASLDFARRGPSGASRTIMSVPTTVAAHHSYHLQAEIKASRIFARVWRTDRRTPGWHYRSDRTPLGAGSVGFIAYSAAHGATLSTNLYGLYAQAAVTPPVLVSTPPTTTPPTTTPPTTTPPTTTPPTTTPPTTTPPTTTPPTTTPPTTTPPTTTPPTTTPPTTTPPTTTPPTTTPPTTTPPTTTPPTTTPPTTTPPTTTPPTTTPPTTTPPTTTPPTTTPPTTVDAGSAPLGTTDYPVPSGALYVATNGVDSGSGSINSPFATLSRALNAAGKGATIVLRGGSYHQSALVMPGKDVTIESYPHEVVWFDGSVPVAGWSSSGGRWVHSGWTAHFDHSASFSYGSDDGGFVNSAHPMAAYPDQVFVDGAQLQQVAANPTAGQFAVNYTAGTITLGSDPTGHDVRASDMDQALIVGGHVTLRGFGVRRYATPLPEIGTVYFGGQSQKSTLENLLITDNATVGLSTNVAGLMISHVSATNNGMSGIELEADNGGVLQNSVMSGNNIEHFNGEPAAAGVKVGMLDGITIRNNLVENNHDITGIWSDMNTVNFVITGNIVRNNGFAYGIENELSAHGIVANNVITGSRYGYTSFDSGYVKVFNNYVDNNSVWDIGLTQDNRWQPGMNTAGPGCLPGSYNRWLVDYVTVYNNTFGPANGMFQFYVLDKQTNRPAASMHIDLQGNAFATRTSQKSSPYVIGWGGSDNVTVHMYSTPAQFNAGEGKAWTNYLSGDLTALQTPAGMPLPSDVAAAVAQPTGTRHVGTF